MNYRHRFMETKLARMREVLPVLLVTGPRQAGKSTLLAHSVPNAKHVVFDPVIDVANAREDPELFLGQYLAPVILDEIQYAPELLGVIKRWTDRSPEPGQYFLSGSQNLSMLRSVSESLAGRVAILELPLLSLAERCGLGGDVSLPWVADLFEEDAFDRLSVRDRLPVRDLEPTLFSRLWRGGYPRFLDMPNDVLPDLFRSYVQTYVERDVRQVADVSDQQLFTRFLALCAAITGQEVNHSQLGRELGVTPQTAARWLATLTATYQWTEIPPYHGNTIKRISKRPKGYFVDTGLAAWLQRISSPEALAGHPLQGALFETHVTQDILRSAQLLQTPPRAHHWRSHAGAEVDLVLERDGQFVPVEIKSKTRVTAGDARGIRAFRETYPALRQGTAAIVAAVERVSSLGEDITVIPYDLA